MSRTAQLRVPGPLALIGGAEWHDGCHFDLELLEASGADEVVVIPAAAAYERPDRVVDRGRAHFASLGARVIALPVLQRRDAEDGTNIEIVQRARFIYIADGSSLHLRSVLKNSGLWHALVEAWWSGAVIAGSSAGGMVLGDPMVDPRGGAFTLGLGLFGQLALVPHWERWTGDRARRMTSLIPAKTVVAEVEEQTALIRWSDGRWVHSGLGSITLTLGQDRIDLDHLTTAVQIVEPPDLS